MEDNNQQETQPVPSTPAQSTIPRWVVLLLLFVFPPLAWYFMWKNEKYHKWFPILLWIYGLLSLVLFTIITFFVYPQINALYNSLNLEKKNTWLPYAAYLAIALAIGEIFFGLFLYRKVKHGVALHKKLLAITIVILFFQWITVPIWAVVTELSVITPIYMLTSSFDEQPSITPAAISPTPKTDPTANWKTYTDTKEGFSFKYPVSWKIKENMGQLYLNDGINNNTKDYQIYVRVQYYDINKAMDYLDYSDAGASVKADNISIEKLVGREVTKADITYTTPTSLDNNPQYKTKKHYRVLIPLANKTIVLEASQGYKDYANQILSTFKFLGGNQSSSESTTEIKESENPTQTKKLTLTTISTAEANKNTITISTISDTNKLTLFSKDIGKASGINIPANNWSLDEQYAYVIMVGPDYINPLLFRASGERFADGKTYLELGQLLPAATGYYLNGNVRWISNIELAFSTVTNNFQKGPDYTFDVADEIFRKKN